jgi:hypothetical protein
MNKITSNTTPLASDKCRKSYGIWTVLFQVVVVLKNTIVEIFFGF